MVRVRTAVVVLWMAAALGCGGKSSSNGGGTMGTGGSGANDAAASGGSDGAATSGSGGSSMGGSGGNGTDAGSGGAGGSGPSCRTAAQACAMTTDCCTNLICINNSCTTPPQCRAATEACAVTADCCNPLVCLQNKCQTAPTTSTMNWTFQNQCLASNPVEIRLFDDANQVQWPADPSMVYVLGYGDTRQVSITCQRGAEVCYGADQPDLQVFWGVDIDDSVLCNDCCATCNGIDPAGIALGGCN